MIGPHAESARFRQTEVTLEDLPSDTYAHRNLLRDAELTRRAANVNLISTALLAMALIGLLAEFLK